MPHEDGSYTDEEKSLATDVAKLLFAKQMTQRCYEDGTNTLDHWDVADRETMRNQAEMCFEAGLMFAWAYHRVLDQCPDRFERALKEDHASCSN